MVYEVGRYAIIASGCPMSRAAVPLQRLHYATAYLRCRAANIDWVYCLTLFRAGALCLAR